MTTEEPSKSNSQRPTIIIAGAIVAAGALIGGGLYLGLKEEAPTAPDPAALHESNQEQLNTSAREQMEATLKSAAVAQEAHFTQTSFYTPDLADLQAQGLDVPPNVGFDPIIVNSNVSYCMTVHHFELTPQDRYYYDSEVGEVAEGECPGLSQ